MNAHSTLHKQSPTKNLRWLVMDEAVAWNRIFADNPSVLSLLSQLFPAPSGVSAGAGRSTNQDVLVVTDRKATDQKATELKAKWQGTCTQS